MGSTAKGVGATGQAGGSHGRVTHMFEVLHGDALAGIVDREFRRLVEQPRDFASQPSAGSQQEFDHRTLRKIRSPAKWQNTLEGAEQPSELVALSPPWNLERREAAAHLCIGFQREHASAVPTTTTLSFRSLARY